MREIEFRVWDNKEDKYLDSEEIAIDNLGNIFIFEGYQEDYEVWNARVLDKTNARFIIEQYTGFKDKNGKKIYAGDIVKHDVYLVGIKAYRSRSEVFISDLGVRIREDGHDEECSLLRYCTDIEIVGNIH